MTLADSTQNTRSNVPEMSVSELAFSLKKTIEDTYGRVRIRGELSRVKIHTSGHMYSDLKDDSAVINVVCWKGTVAQLSLTPEEGLEVICTGRISTYPARSNYQMIIDSMELAGEGALLKMLEERKKRLAAEGLFSPEQKKKLPFLPQRIGVVTSQTGAVFRDIMHRLNDRFPRPVLLWPVPVQGTGAAEQVAAAITGLNSLPPHLRPDLIIVARGGGSLEDLMAFNEEIVVRAAAESAIPLISAIGHETDTTLLDYAADLRAPTPTGAAELAVPRRIDLHAQILENEQRLTSCASRLIRTNDDKLNHIAARLGEPKRLLEIKIQALDHSSHKIVHSFQAALTRKQARTAELGAMLRHPAALIENKNKTLAYHTERLAALEGTLFKDRFKELQAYGRMLESLSFKSILNRGYVVVRDKNGIPVTEAAQTYAGQNIQLTFRNNEKVDAVIEKPGKGDRTASPSPNQGKLL